MTPRLMGSGRARARSYERESPCVAEMVARIVERRLANHLERSGFVVMRKSSIGGGAALKGGFDRQSKALGHLVRHCDLSKVPDVCPYPHVSMPRYRPTSISPPASNLDRFSSVGVLKIGKTMKSGRPLR